MLWGDGARVSIDLSCGTVLVVGVDEAFFISVLALSVEVPATGETECCFGEEGVNVAEVGVSGTRRGGTGGTYD